MMNLYCLIGVLAAFPGHAFSKERSTVATDADGNLIVTSVDGAVVLVNGVDVVDAVKQMKVAIQVVDVNITNQVLAYYLRAPTQWHWFLFGYTYCHAAPTLYRVMLPNVLFVSFFPLFLFRLLPSTISQKISQRLR